jgi:hypothetical protein
MLGFGGAEPVVGVASIVVLAGVICFALAVWLAGERSVVQRRQGHAAV